MAIIPHLAGTASSSQMIAPLSHLFSLVLVLGQSFFIISLWNLKSPKQRVVSFDFIESVEISVLILLKLLPEEGLGMILWALCIGSATIHPTIL